MKINILLPYKEKFDENKASSVSITVKNNLLHSNYLNEIKIFGQNVENPFFNYLPSKPSKGETIVIECDQFPELLINRGCFVYPLSKNNFLVGATYKHNDLSYQSSKESREELISKLMNIGDFKSLSNSKKIFSDKVKNRLIFFEKILFKMGSKILVS